MKKKRKSRSHFGYITYLSDIMRHTNKKNGALLDCTKNSRDGTNELCFLLSNAVESKKRSMPRYVGHGAFGTVYIIKVGRSEIALKHVEIYSPEKFQEEIDYQREVASAGIAPQIYDYFYCTCNGKLYGTILMEYLKGYMREYKLYEFIEKSQLPLEYINQIMRPVIQKTIDIINIIVDHFHLKIGDFQIMIKNDLSDVKVIDFGLAEKINPGENIEEIKQAMKNRIFYLN